MKFLTPLLFFAATAAPAQSLPVRAGEATETWMALARAQSAAIRADDLLNERILDLVEPRTADSTYKRKTERHQFVGAAPLRWMGVRWKTVRYTREKYVGTVLKTTRSRKERFTEYDVNFDVYPHLPRYRELAWIAYQDQMRLFKARKKVREGEPPWIEPTASVPFEPYKIHCEVTPDRESRVRLNDAFYPAVGDAHVSTHPNFLDPNPSVGMYGPLVLDCNHKCHPEIHPYEWIWWLDLTLPPDAPEGHARSWYVGLLRDVSNRFMHWSSSPRIGTIAIPFALPSDAEGWRIEIEHLVYDGFVGDALHGLDVPQTARTFEEPTHRLALEGQGMTGRVIAVEASHRIDSPDFRWWVDGLRVDATKGLLMGWLHLAMAVEDLYTARISFRAQPAR